MAELNASLAVSDQDAYLFAQGKWFQSHKKLGAHPAVQEDGVEGYHFAVWAPNAASVSVVGDFNNWDDTVNVLSRSNHGGIWEGFIPGITSEVLYKFLIVSASGQKIFKADPYGTYAEVRPHTASITFDPDVYVWEDEAWMKRRATLKFLHSPLNIFEVHLGSWKQHTDVAVQEEDSADAEDANQNEEPKDYFDTNVDAFYTYDDLSEELVAYVKDMGYTHIELLPVMEHPFDGSWGYQVTGYFAPTSRYGNPAQFKHFIDCCHQAGIGVILDWVPGGFCKDAHGLAEFDGTKLFEEKEHPNWGTLKFDLTRGEVRSFLVSNLLMWLKDYHADGIRVDGVSSMLYLNFGIDDPSQKRFNHKGTEEDLDASAFLRLCNETAQKEHPDILMIAEESTAWPLVTYPPEVGGLGFNLKWDMGWMNDTLHYCQTDFPYRPGNHRLLTFSSMYQFNENFVLPLSHDEVVHGKCSLIQRMPGDWWRQFAGMRALALHQMTHPGAKLNFMGNEIAQFIEWRYYEGIEYYLTEEYPTHAHQQAFIKALNHFYKNHPGLWQHAYDNRGFDWIDADNNEQSIISFVRHGRKPSEDLVILINFDVATHQNFRLGMPSAGVWKEVFNSDAKEFGGSGIVNTKKLSTKPVAWNGRDYSVELSVPPLGGIVLAFEKELPKRGSMAVNNGQNIFTDKQDFEEQYRDKFIKILGKYYGECTVQERYNVLAHLIAEKAREIQSTSYIHANKQVYYFSLEFLLGPLLENYLLNLGITDVVAEGLKEMGTSLQELAAQEVDPGLGNGGLGRLAACFLDSMAHEGMAGFGNGMRYRYGLFRQEIKDGRQVERTDNWLANGYPWEVRKDDSSVLVRFGGTVVRHEDENGNFWFSQEGGQVVRAVPYDVPIVGYGAKTVNKLRLWSAEPAEEDFDLDAFNAGDYARANKFRSDVEAISTILYPNDSGEHGRILRLKQEYLFVSAGLQTILRAYKDKYGEDWEHFADHVCIHTNDTHPAMCGPELMRLLVDDHGVDFNEAFDIARNAISYTNHTVMPEALEKWPINTFRELLPRLYMFIDEVDRCYKEQLLVDSNGNTELLASTAVLWDNTVRMANLSILFSHSVNGVSDLHTNILKQSVLKDFYKLRPEIFNNKTNGICHRRFLAQANTAYAKLITEAIGTGWLDDANELQKLSAFENNAEFLDKMDAAKKEEKERLAAYVKKTTGVEMDTNTIFDTQVKRFHAYKRQLLNVFKILYLYNRMLDDPSYKPAPTTFIFSGKAAQSYTFAKEVIRLIHSVADVVNNDERIEGRLKIVFIPNFAVSNAQLIYAASDISEQISVAGAEASGTSNMKLMMNAALTLGTYDGSNIEISELAGPENIKIFGLRADEVQEVYASGTYFAQNLLNQNPTLARIVNMLTDGSLSRLSGNFESIHDYLLINNDPDLVLIDFDAYVKAWEELTQSYADRRSWNARALHNTANSGFFSADRTIREYMEDIWHV